jgi:hypothetical protein
LSLAIFFSCDLSEQNNQGLTVGWKVLLLVAFLESFIGIFLGRQLL